jgi:NitT/TauT family transport system substrate-binding protein
MNAFAKVQARYGSPLTAAVLLASVLIALGGRPAPAQEVKAWRHGIVEAKSDAGFVFMARNGGFAQKQGLKIDLVQFKGDALALKAMLAGELDSYEGSPGGPMLAAAHGAEIKIVGCFWPIPNYGIFAKPGIAGPGNLQGKTLAISAPGALPDLLARAVLEQNHVEASEVRFTVMGSDTDRYRALAAGVVDAAAASTEFVPLAQLAGLRLLVHAHDAVPNYLRFCTYTASKTLATRRDQVVRFLAAEITALRYAIANRDATIALAKEISEAKPDDPRAAYIYDEVARYSSIVPEMPIPKEKLDWMQALLVKTGNLDKTFDLAPMIDDSARRSALDLAGIK